MDIIFRNPGLKYSVDSIMLFQNEQNSDWWRRSLFHFFPQINREYFECLDAGKKYDYIGDVLRALYLHEEAQIDDKVINYNQHWKLHQEQVEEAFSEAFQYDCCANFNNIIGNITLNPICPRFLATYSFDVFYMNSAKGAIGTALHEITHFVWFMVWQKHFHDSESEYETPHLKWVFSEMAVEPIMRKDSRLSGINPYFATGCVYDYFYKMIVDGKPILDTLYAIYERSDIISFMEQGYTYCKRHEDEIRSQML